MNVFHPHPNPLPKRARESAQNAMDTIHCVVVVGTTGSGKTTFASRLARLLAAPYIELDSLYWEPGWVEAPPEIFRERVERALSGEGWVVDGNYSKVRDIIWQRADTVVWLDLPFRVVLWRLTRRTFERAIYREELWSGNRESLWTHFFTRESLFLWLFQTYWRRKREYPMLFALPENAHLRTVRLRSTRQADNWLATITSPHESQVEI